MNFKIIIIPTVIDIIIKLGFLEILVSDFNIIFTDIIKAPLHLPTLISNMFPSQGLVIILPNPCEKSRIVTQADIISGKLKCP